MTAFELDNYCNYVLTSKNIESAFEAKLSLKEKGKEIKESQSESEDELEKSSDSDLKVVETLLARKYSRGKGKYKGEVPLIYFHVRKLVILLLDAQTSKSRMKRKVTNGMARKISNYSRTKVRKHVLWLKTLRILTIVKMKLFTLL